MQTHEESSWFERPTTGTVDQYTSTNSTNGWIWTQQIHHLKWNGGHWIVGRGRCSALVWDLDIVFVHEDIPAVEWAAEHYFDGCTTWCWWEARDLQEYVEVLSGLGLPEECL